MTTATERATAYRVGICNASVCAPKDMPIETVENQINADHPTGIDSRWQKSPDPHFANGPTNPCPCEQDEGRQHWLLSC